MSILQSEHDQPKDEYQDQFSTLGMHLTDQSKVWADTALKGDSDVIPSTQMISSGQ